MARNHQCTLTVNDRNLGGCLTVTLDGQNDAENVKSLFYDWPASKLHAVSQALSDVLALPTANRRTLAIREARERVKRARREEVAFYKAVGM